MLTKTEQHKEAASLTEKVVMSIGQNVREHIGITKDQMEVINRDQLYDDVYDVIIAAYRIADFVTRHGEEEEE